MARGSNTPTYDTIRQALADLIFVDAWASALEERGERPGGPGVDLMDVAPRTPESAVEIADGVIASIERLNGKSIDTLLAGAAKADGNPDLANSADYANKFGYALGFMVRGQGVSWFDDHAKFPLRVPVLDVIAFEDEKTGEWLLSASRPDERFAGEEGYAKGPICVRLRTYTAEIVRGSSVRGGDLVAEEVICGPTLFDAILTAVLQGYRSNYNFHVIEHPENPSERRLYWTGRIEHRYLANATDREELERLILDRLAKMGIPHKFNGFGALPPSDTWLVAYQERESYDPQTGEPGILRDEWRVRLVGDFTPEELRAAWGDDWRRYKPFASHVLEHRYIRRGVEEPWTPFDAANSFKQAIEYIDDKAIAVDPQLQQLQEDRCEYAAKQHAEAAAKRKAEVEAEERRYHQGRSDDAFRKLTTSKWVSLAERWNAFVAAHDSSEYREQAKNNPEFMRLYLAVMEAETVPAKRKAIREFLARFDKEGGSVGALGGEADELDRLSGFDGLSDDVIVPKCDSKNPREC